MWTEKGKIKGKKKVQNTKFNKGSQANTRAVQESE
jgi:hypothetical protein